MPLVVATLKDALESTFASPPATHAECAQAWADAMESYAGAVVPPSTTAAAAATALSAALAAAFASPSGVVAMESAFTAFAATLGGGMAGYVPTPPAGPVGFVSLFAGPYPETHAQSADGIATAVDTWMRTGIATLAAPPATAIPWS